MQAAAIIGGQAVLMGLLTLVGVFSAKKGLMTEPVCRVLSGFLLNIALPCVMISSLYRPKMPELLPGFALTVLLALIMHIIGIICAKLLIKKREGFAPHAERFSIVFANSIYMGLPMIRAALGEDATFYAAAFSVIWLSFHWTYGIKEMGESIQLSKIIKNPCILAIAAGLLIFLLQIPLPVPLYEAIKQLAGLTTPLSMIIAGVFLSELKLSELRGREMYRAAAVRMIIAPVISIAAVSALGCAGWFPGARVAALAAVYSFACPAAVSVILMSASLGKDAAYAGRLVAINTVLSLVALPAMAALAERLI